MVTNMGLVKDTGLLYIYTTLALFYSEKSFEIVYLSLIQKYVSIAELFFRKAHISKVWTASFEHISRI